MSKGTSVHSAKQGRLAALVIAATGLLWLGMQYAATQVDLSGRVLALFDLMALAAFAWALIVTFGIWRSRQSNGD